MPLKCIQLYFFQKKKYLKKMCLPTLPKIFLPLPETHYFFIWPKPTSGHKDKNHCITKPLPITKLHTQGVLQLQLRPNKKYLCSE